LCAEKIEKTKSYQNNAIMMRTWHRLFYSTMCAMCELYVAIKYYTTSKQLLLLLLLKHHHRSYHIVLLVR
jgi:hypothetical protein